MPQRADLRRATSSSGPRRNRIATPTWADEIFGKHNSAAVMKRLSKQISLALRKPRSQGMELYSTNPPRNCAWSEANTKSMTAASIHPA